MDGWDQERAAIYDNWKVKGRLSLFMPKRVKVPGWEDKKFGIIHCSRPFIFQDLP